LLTFVVAQVGNYAVAIAGTRLAASSLKAGRYPLWGFTYFRWWLGTRFQQLPDTYLLAGTPWIPLYLRALGARIGRGVIIDAVTVAVPGLLRVDEGASIGAHVNIENARVEAGQLIIGPVHLKSEAVVDSYSVLENDCVVGANAILGGQSALSAGSTVPDGETWEGAPARSSNRPRTQLPPRESVSAWRQWAQTLLFAITAIGVAVLFFLPTFPAFMLIDWLDVHTWSVFDAELHPIQGFLIFFLLAVPASSLLVCLTMLLTSILLRRLMPRQKAGCYSVHSFAFWRKKAVTMVLDSSLHVLHGLYASIYARAWLRALGVKVGRRAEISTAEGMVPELLSLGEDSFIADGVMLGDEEVRGGWMVLQPTSVGNRSFIGNGAYVPDGTSVPDDVLVGVQTRCPANEQLRSGQTWMGSPPLLLPAREQIQGFPESLTFRPSNIRKLGRGLVEGLRLVLPLAAVIATGYLLVILIMPMVEEGWQLRAALALCLAGCLYGLGSFLFVVALKWLLVGRYKPCAIPMWTPFVWLSEAVTNLYESLAVPNALDILCGTPLLPWALRLLGVRIGRGAFLNTTDMTEFDCVEIGDEAELNAWCGPQTHLFEDRVMKIGRVEIGAQTTVGVRSTILYDASVGQGSSLGPLTLVAKGERLPPGTRWEGSPASAVLERPA
jgi:non-ribosomal peptide synthetase-like protein